MLRPSSKCAEALRVVKKSQKLTGHDQNYLSSWLSQILLAEEKSLNQWFCYCYYLYPRCTQYLNTSLCVLHKVSTDQRFPGVKLVFVMRGAVIIIVWKQLYLNNYFTCHIYLWTSKPIVCMFPINPLQFSSFIPNKTQSWFLFLFLSPGLKVPYYIRWELFLLPSRLQWSGLAQLIIEKHA